MKNLEAVRAAIIKAVPEIVVHHDPEWCPRCGEDFTEAADIPRPIRLADVLVAMNHAVSYEIWPSSTENFTHCYIGITENSRTKFCQWNLHTDDLSQQSEECIDFLASLLTNSK